jgi:hypothetical protein
MRFPRRSFVLGLVCFAVALGVLVVPVLAAELLGTIKSVDADNNKFVVTSVDGKDVTVTATNATEYENAKGKASKKFQLTRRKGPPNPFVQCATWHGPACHGL